jgi:hypothetical protein
VPERPNPEQTDITAAAGRPGAMRCRIDVGAIMFARRIYRGLPTIVLFVVAALLQFLAVSVFV